METALNPASNQGYLRERHVATAAVRRAMRLCERVRSTLIDADTLLKRDRSPVTVADFGAQAVIAMALAEAFPDDPIVGEEEAEALGQAPAALRLQVVAQVTGAQREDNGVGEQEVLDAIGRCSDPGGAAGRRWVLDPIDGTLGFLRGDQYAVALALLDDGEAVLGVLGCPRLPHRWLEPGAGRGCLFAASRGEGAMQQLFDEDGQPMGDADGGERIRVAEVEEPGQAIFCESVESSHSAHERHAAIASRLGVERPPVRIDSQCKYAALARGDASIYLRLPSSASYQEKIWDHAAGCVVVEQAGGVVTDAHGQPLDFSRGHTLSQNRGIVATNGRFHASVAEAVSATAHLAPQDG